MYAVAQSNDIEANILHMDDTIQILRAASTLTKEHKSDKYLDTCKHDNQLAHEVMADWAQKTVSFPVPKSQMRVKGKSKQKCTYCGNEEGGWGALHNRVDLVTGLRVCPHKGINCSGCKKYGLLTLDTNEHYINRAVDACPLNNMSFFEDRLVTSLISMGQM